MSTLTDSKSKKKKRKTTTSSSAGEKADDGGGDDDRRRPFLVDTTTTTASTNESRRVPRKVSLSPPVEEESSSSSSTITTSTKKKKPKTYIDSDSDDGEDNSDDDEVQVVEPPTSTTTSNSHPRPTGVASLKKEKEDDTHDDEDEDDVDDDVEMVDVKPAPATTTTSAASLKKADDEDDDNDDEDVVVVGDDDDDDVVEVDTTQPGEATAAAAAAAAAPPPATAEELMAEAEREEKKKAKDDIRNQRELDRMFDQFSRDKYNGLEPYVQPEGFKNDVELHEHQQDGVRWLVHQERNENSRQCPFFKQTHRGQNPWWFNTVTRRLQKETPIPDRGSILADDMGLGKTIQTLGLMLSCMPKDGEPRTTLLVCPLSVIAAWQFQIDKFCEEDFLEVVTYLGPQRQKVLNRIKRKNDVDVLITSYETLMSDFNNYKEYIEEKEEQELEKKKAKAKKQSKKKKAAKRRRKSEWDSDGSEDDWSPSDSDEDSDDDHYLPSSILTSKRGRGNGAVKRPSTWIFELVFHRVVLDEGHKIRNPKTKFNKSCCAIQADRRLIITGTPYVNKPSDIQALLVFLNSGHKTCNPLVDHKIFKAAVTVPIEMNKLIGLSRVRLQMGVSCLRRTKAVVDLRLPPKTINVIKIPFEKEGFHSETHRLLYDVARQTFLSLLGTKEFYKNFYQFFSLVMRVRQSCCDGSLVPQDAFDRAQAAYELLEGVDNLEDIRMDEDEAQKLLEKLLEVLKPPSAEIPDVCGICLEQFDQDTAVALRSCSHVFCQTCIDKCLETNPRQGCPICREPYKSKDKITFADLKKILEKQHAQEQKKKDKEATSNEDEEQAPKITAMLEKINEMKPTEKGLIFSQWTSYLDNIEDALEENGHTFTRIDGSVSAEDRLEAMKEFDKDDGPRFCLISLMAGGVGITLTRANVAFMMDPWWNAAMQDQAMDRCHRIGQTRPVRVYQLAMEGSIEERMYRLQEAKTALGNGSLRKMTAEEKKKARITALKDLFQVEQEIKWSGFHGDENGQDTGSDLEDFIVGDDVED